MDAGDHLQPGPARQQAAGEGKVDHRKYIKGHHQHDPAAAEQQIVQLPAGQLLQIALALQGQHPGERRDIGRRQKGDQKQEIPQPGQRQRKHTAQDAERQANHYADQRHAGGDPQRTAEHRRQLRIGQQRRDAAKGVPERTGAKMGKNRLQHNKH